MLIWLNNQCVISGNIHTPPWKVIRKSEGEGEQCSKVSIYI